MDVDGDGARHGWYGQRNLPQRLYIKRDAPYCPLGSVDQILVRVLHAVRVVTLRRSRGCERWVKRERKGRRDRGRKGGVYKERKGQKKM